MYFLWGILALVCLVFVITGLVGVINPAWINKDINDNDNDAPFTRKSATGFFVFMGALFFLFAYLTVHNFESGHTSAANKQIQKKEVVSDQETKKEVGLTQKVDKQQDRISNKVGLGDSIHLIESNIGKPSTVQQKHKDGVGMDAYSSNTIQVSYMNNRAYYYEHYFDKPEITLKEAQAFAESIIPKDAKFTGNKYHHNQGGADELVCVYTSESIKHLWPSDMFDNVSGETKLGEFDVIYEYDTLNHPNSIMSVIVGAGDNP